MDLVHVIEADATATEAVGEAATDKPIDRGLLPVEPQVQFVDVSTAMLDSSGKPQRDFYRWDGLRVSNAMQCGHLSSLRFSWGGSLPASLQYPQPSDPRTQGKSGHWVLTPNFSTEMARGPEQHSVPNELARLNYCKRSFTMTSPASAIRDEVRELIQAQIETFGQPSRLTSSELEEYRRRAERIKLLGEELDRIATTTILKERFGRAA
jgi:hypothetical protein